MCLIGLKSSNRRCHRSGRIQNVCSNLFPRPSAFIFTEIQMIIFCRNVSWVVQERSAKYKPNCSRIHKMAAILNRKKPHFFPLFSQSVLVIHKRKWVGTLLGVRGTLSRNSSGYKISWMREAGAKIFFWQIVRFVDFNWFIGVDPDIIYDYIPNFILVPIECHRQEATSLKPTRGVWTKKFKNVE